MQLGAANRVTYSANKVLYPVMWDRNSYACERIKGEHNPTS